VGLQYTLYRVDVGRFPEGNKAKLARITEDAKGDPHLCVVPQDSGEPTLGHGDRDVFQQGGCYLLVLIVYYIYYYHLYFHIVYCIIHFYFYLLFIYIYYYYYF